MLSIVGIHGSDDVARIFLADVGGGRLVEFVDSVDPRYPRSEKWCINISTQVGCPVGCLMCDAGRSFGGSLQPEEMLAQIEHVLARHPDLNPAVHPKLKIHLARMGEPLLNPHLPDGLRAIAKRFPYRGVMACLATIAPRSARLRLEEVAEAKRSLFPGGRFQLQFSLNSTDERYRHWMIPFPSLSPPELSEFAASYFSPGDRKINLNFALSMDSPVDPDVISREYDSARFLVKLTPINPTRTSRENGLTSRLSYDSGTEADDLVDALHARGFDVILSIGDPREIELGSNCGQMVTRWLSTRETFSGPPPLQSGTLPPAPY